MDLYLQYNLCICILDQRIPDASQVPWPVVVTCLAILLCIIALTVYQQPFQNGLGFAIFLFGVPLRLIGKLCSTQPHCGRVIGELTLKQLRKRTVSTQKCFQNW
jgi:hypothetical protein